jgi:colanic acid biosynthesis glycosyl transferase WcaI
VWWASDALRCAEGTQPWYGPLVSRPTSVLIVSQHYAPEVTGNAPYVASLARGLHARGVRTEVVTTFPHYPAWTRPPSFRWRASAEDEGVCVTRLAHYIPANPKGWKRLASEASFGLRVLFGGRARADVVVLVSPGLFSSAIARFRFGRRRTLVWVQDLYSVGIRETGASSGVTARFMRWVESRVLLGVGGVITIHDRFKRVISAELRVPLERISVVRNWTHLPASAPIDVASTRTKFGWRADEIVVLHAGNQGVKQGLENVVEAARHAGAIGARIRFVLLGGGNQHRNLKELGRELDQLSFMAALSNEDYQAAMRAADILLVNERPGVAEMSVPSKLTSYFTAGRPILGATDSGSISAEEIARSGTGEVVTPGAPAALVDAVIRLQSSPAYEEYARAGATYISSTLSQTAALDAFTSVIKRTASGAERR